MDLQDNLRSSRQPQALRAHNLWEVSWAGFRHSAGFHARVILDGAACGPGRAWRCAGCTECSRCVVGKVGEEEEVLMEEGAG